MSSDCAVCPFCAYGHNRRVNMHVGMLLKCVRPSIGEAVRARERIVSICEAAASVRCAIEPG